MDNGDGLKGADQVWIATALLHRENPDRMAFTASEIEERVRRDFGYEKLSIPTFISADCVANRKPSPARYRVLHRVSRGMYRLFRPDDPYHLGRERGKTKPNPEEVPDRYRPLLEWYENEYASPFKLFGPDAPLLKITPGDSGLKDVSAAHDRYLAEAAYEEAHRGESPAKP